MRAQKFNRQRGFTLTEALVSFGITATGLLAVASFQGDLFSESAYNKARTEALALAQQKIEQFRHFTHADETNYIDDDGDGAMDGDGTYAENPVTGQNAVFTRSWALSTTSQSKEIDVTVAWTDSSNVNQSVVLEASVPWVTPRGGADQIAGFDSPLLNSPTGRAEVGDGVLDDYTDEQGNGPTLVASPGDDGLSTYNAGEDLLLVDDQNKVLLTLLDACNLSTQQCTDFVKVSGKVYLDTGNSNNDLVDTYVIASNAAHCERFVPSGTLANPPTTDSGDYEYYQYTCYIGGGWHGNIGIVTAPDSIQQTDKVCQGDPTSGNGWEQPVIALRRAYRGMLHKTYNGETIYESHGIKDAATMTGHDFVFTQLATSATEGTNCWGYDKPMTRTDSQNGGLFSSVPTDFVCLNHDDDNDSNPDYLDGYDTSEWSANTTCPFDPTDPPVQSHTISGVVSVATSDTSMLNGIGLTTSDGPGNCAWLTDFATSGIDTYAAGYVCQVFDWGTGWTGSVELLPNSNQLFCPNSDVDFANVTGNETLAFACIGTTTIYISGYFGLGDRAEFESISIGGLLAGEGFCKVGVNDYACVLPYEGVTTVDVALRVTSPDVVCGSNDGLFVFYEASVDQNPINQDIWIETRANLCP